MPRQARLDIPGALHHIIHDWKKKGEYNRVEKDTWDITSPQQSLKIDYFIDGKIEHLIKQMARCEAMKLGT